MSGEEARLIVEESRAIRAEMTKVNPGSPRHKERQAALDARYRKGTGR